MAVPKRKLTVNLGEDVLDLLQDLADRNGTTLTEELRRAISDRQFMLERIGEGDAVYLEREDRDGENLIRERLIWR